MPPILVARGPWRLVALAALAAAALAACSSQTERRDRHLARAESYAEADQIREALIELRSALKLDPQSSETNFRLAELLERSGRIPDALFFFGEARRLDPSHSEAALREARLLLFEDSDRAEELIEGVLAREPDSADAYVTKSQLALVLSEPEEALKSALTAIELAPDGIGPHQQAGMVHQARIQLLQRERATIPEELFRAALQSFQRAAELADEEDRWNHEYQIARVLASWPDRHREATKAYQDAVASAEKARGPEPLRVMLDAAARYAELQGDDELARWTLERHLEIAPEALESWTRLALLEERSSGSGAGVMERMLEALGSSADAHVRYAQFLVTVGRPDDALAHLERVGRSGDRAELLAAHGNFLLGLGQTEQARSVVQRLGQEHPNHPSTALAQAQLALAERRVSVAAEILRASAATRGGDHADAHRLLASAELRLGNLQAARTAIERALELSASERGFPEEIHRLRARILTRTDDCTGALRSVAALRRADHEIDTPGRVDMAHCLYETGRGDLGRRILIDVVRRPQPPVSAVLEFARREGHRRPERARELLENAAAVRPNDAGLAVHLARFDLADRNPERALQRLDTVIARGGGVSAELVLERARVRAFMGEIELAQRDALQAFEVRPDLEGAAALLVQLYRAQGKVDEIIVSFEQAESAGALAAPARVLLARLYLLQGEREKARAALEAALAERSDLPGAKNDLAFLLAREDEDLDRALRLAQEAVQALRERPEAADTLGFVYLKRGLLEPALQQFRYAIELAEREQSLRAVYPYHLGLALARLGQEEAAAAAFQRALAIDADFQDAAVELRRLDGSAERTEEGARTS
jgi:tetratricopeptide (TPR) repeat protein